MKLGWHRAAQTRPVDSAPPAASRLATPDACAVASQTTTDHECAVGEQADTTAPLLDAALGWELRLLCRGLVRCSWCDTLRAVSTDAGLPADEAHELALRALCWELAEQFGIEQTVYRRDNTWIVRFSRRESGMAATEEDGEYSRYRADTPILGGIARHDKTPWNLHGPRLRGRTHPA